MTDTNTQAKAALLEHQQNLVTAQTAITRLNAEISAQESLIQQKQAQTPDLDTLKNQRANMLAEIALGQKTAQDMDALDTALADAQTLQQSLGPAIQRAKETIEGLQRLRTVKEQELQALQEQNNRLEQEFLRSEAEAEGEKYLLLARELEQRYKRLEALNVLLFERQGSRIKVHGPVLHIPCFYLEAHKPYVVNHNNNNNNALFTAPTLGGEIRQWAHEEKQRLQAAGMSLA